MSLTAEYNDFFESIESKVENLVDKFGMENPFISGEKVLDLTRFDLEFDGVKPAYMTNTTIYSSGGYHYSFDIVSNDLFSLCEVLDDIDGEPIHTERQTPISKST